MEIKARGRVPQTHPKSIARVQLPPGDAFIRGEHGYPTAYLDPHVEPQKDFYQYATGGYQAGHPLSADRASTGAYTQQRAHVKGQVQKLLQAAADRRDAAPGSPDQLMGDLYASGLDKAQSERAGFSALKPVLAAIDQVQSTADLADQLASLHRQGLGTLFTFGAAADPHDPDHEIAAAGQTGMGLPSPQFYTDPSHQAARAGYQAYMQTLFGLLGDDEATAAHQADAVMRLETQLAAGALTPAQRRDPVATCNLTDRAALQALTPHFPWDGFVDKLGRSDIGQVDIESPAYFKNLDRLLGTVPMADWRAYLRLHVASQMAPHLSKAFRQAEFEYKGRVLSGTPAPASMPAHATALVDEALGDAVGQKYVAQYFSPPAKAAALDMVNTVRAVLRHKIEQSQMRPETRAEALKKVDHMKVRVGYPDRWESYAGLRIDRGPLVDNVLRIKAWQAQRNLARIGGVRDHDRWPMTVATVNACYSSEDNSVTVPAARLQPPFFDPKQDPALNYGATGITIGHEITHGFDDSGSHYDWRGALRDWKQPGDRTTFQHVADGVEHQFDQYVYDGQHVNGRLVEGESLADLGGVELGYDALHRALRQQPDGPVAHDGFTSDQRFFLGWALVREQVSRPQAAHLQIATDPHPLGRFRVDGPLTNFQPFYDAFNVTPTDPMYTAPAQRNHVWG